MVQNKVKSRYVIPKSIESLVDSVVLVAPEAIEHEVIEDEMDFSICQQGQSQGSLAMSNTKEDIYFGVNINV